MTNSKACFSFVLIFAFFVSSHHVLAREFPNDNVEVDDLKGSTNNNILWTIPLTPTKTEEDHYTTPSVGYYSRNPHQGNDPVLPMLFFRRNKNKKPPETGTHTPPKQQPEQHIHNPNTHPHNPHPYYPNDPPTHPYYPDDPPTNYQRPNPLMGVIPLLEPLIRGQNGEGPESEKVDPESKKIPPPDDGEEDSMDNIAHHSIGYNPYSSYQYQSSGFQNIGKRLSAYNMEEVDELKGSNNNLEWTIPLKPTKIEKDHYTNPSIGNYHRDSYRSNTLILPMLRKKRRRLRRKPDPPQGTNTNPKNGSQSHDPPHDPTHGPPHDPLQGPPQGQHHDPPHGPYHDPPHGPNSGPYNPYNDPNTGRYNPYNGPDYYGDGSGMDYPSDPSTISQIWNMFKNWKRRFTNWYNSNPNNHPDEESPPVDEDEPSSDRPHSSIGYNPYRSYQYYVLSALPQTPSNNYYTLPFSYNPNHYLQWNHHHVSPKILNAGYSANFAAYQPSPFQHFEAENYKDGNVVWNHKMKSPSEIGWSTNYGDNEKERMN